MIPNRIEKLIEDPGYSIRPNCRRGMLAVLQALNLDPTSELSEFYLTFDPSLLTSNTSYEQLEDITQPYDYDHEEPEYQPEDTPIHVATMFIREVWDPPTESDEQSFIQCREVIHVGLTSTRY